MNLLQSGPLPNDKYTAIQVLPGFDIDFPMLQENRHGFSWTCDIYLAKLTRLVGDFGDTSQVSMNGEVMYNSEMLLDWQKDQYDHDMRNHFDVLSLHKKERLKHYAMHFAKYAGRLARGNREEKSIERTFVDALLVCLSAANTLQQRLSYSANRTSDPILIRLADAAGRFNDATEKIDHVEPFLEIARESNQDILDTLLDFAVNNSIDVIHILQSRRSELRERQFFIREPAIDF